MCAVRLSPCVDFLLTPCRRALALPCRRPSCVLCPLGRLARLPRAPATLSVVRSPPRPVSAPASASRLTRRAAPPPCTRRSCRPRRSCPRVGACPPRHAVVGTSSPLRRASRVPPALVLSRVASRSPSPPARRPRRPPPRPPPSSPRLSPAPPPRAPPPPPPVPLLPHVRSDYVPFLRRIPRCYVQHLDHSFRGGNHGQQGQGRFKELKDRGEQVAEGEAPGEEGESQSSWRFFDGSIDQQVARVSDRWGWASAQALFAGRRMRAVPLLGAIMVSCPSAHRTR